MFSHEDTNPGATDRARTEGEAAGVGVLSNSNRRLRLAFEQCTAGTILVDLEDKVLEVNDTFCEMLGRSNEEIVGKPSELFTYPEDLSITAEARHRLTSGEADQVSYTKRFLHRNGRVIVADVSKCPVRDATGSTLCFVTTVRDVTEERALSAQLSHQALHDPLTGLANRVLFENRLSLAHARTARRGGWNAVMLLDLDDFKAVNDTLGHLVGDKLLVALARRLEVVTRSSDTLCRFGGDEFIYLAEELVSPTQAEEVTERLLGVFAKPFSLAGTQVTQHASVGAVVLEGTGKAWTELIQDADAALYEAKRQGKGSHVVFASTMHNQAVNRSELLRSLGHSLSSGQVSMHYQPIVDLTTREAVGFEALMRWQHPAQGQVPPTVFIPLAEQTDLILELGSFALHEAVGQAQSWGRVGKQALLPYVTVNLSARQFHDPELLSTVKEALSASGLAPERLVFEIKESVALVDVVETKRVIERLDHYGVSVAIDNFGTGYSSLSYLALLHPMIIKIDRSFVSPSRASIYNDTLLEAIISLGHKLDMTVLAEGIETRAQLERLRHLRCEAGQGYLFSPTVPAGEVAAMLGSAPGNWNQSLAPSPPTGPPPFRSGADAPHPSDTAHRDQMDSRSGSPGAPIEAPHQPERRKRWPQA
jgi:Amt family ammonium transporter